MSRTKLKQEIIDIFLRNLEGKTLEAMADEVINAAYAALKVPTTVMYENAHGHYEGEAFLPHGLWQAMLAASPLAPQGRKTI